MAERYAWEHHQEHECAYDLVTLQPGFIVGPPIISAPSASLDGVAMIMKGSIPRIPKLAICCIDVRDCAKSHLLAL